jgi:hypothetical protein
MPAGDGQNCAVSSITWPLGRLVRRLSPETQRGASTFELPDAATLGREGGAAPASPQVREARVVSRSPGGRCRAGWRV